jgi:hypothetical protein
MPSTSTLFMAIGRERLASVVTFGNLRVPRLAAGAVRYLTTTMLERWPEDVR